MAKVDNEQSDFLSKMPDDILSSIISSLCIKDVAKVRTLSRRWRYVCPSNSNLEFDMVSVLGGNVCKLSERKCEFVHAVGQCLKMYEGTRVDSLRISFPLQEEDSNHINNWISSALRAGAQKPDLGFESCPRRYRFYEFASPILLSERKLFQLKELRLNSCKLMPSLNLGGVFISLKKLYLVEVFLDNTSTDTIISNGLNLECLSLSSCDLPEGLNIEGPPLHLKSLILRDCRGVENIDISCKSLIIFEYTGSSLINLFFHEVPHLEKVHVLFLRDWIKAFEYTYNMLPRDVPHLQYLSVSSITASMVPPTPLNITRFYHLKQMDLFLVPREDTFNLLSVTFILDAAPHLQQFRLSLKLEILPEEHVVYLDLSTLSGKIIGYCRPVEQQNYLNYVHNHLKEVEVHGFKGAANEMELVIYLLKNALTLKQMTLSRQIVRYFGFGSWRKGNESLSDEKKQYVQDSVKGLINCNTKLVLV